MMEDVTRLEGEHVRSSIHSIAASEVGYMPQGFGMRYGKAGWYVQHYSKNGRPNSDSGPYDTKEIALAAAKAQGDWP